MQELFILSANPCTIFILIKYSDKHNIIYHFANRNRFNQYSENRHMKNTNEMHVIIIFLDRSNNSISKHI